MPTACDYAAKFAAFQQHPLFAKLSHEQQDFVRELAFAHRFTFQEFRQAVNACRDLALWGQPPLQDWWQTRVTHTQLHGVALKKNLLRQLQAHLDALQNAPPFYDEEPRPRPKHREKHGLAVEKSGKKIYGMCPVASDKTVCCNLRTIDAVENCVFGCSYCSIQTFYRDQIVFDEDFAEKLRALPIAPNRFYHFGTGQASDALVWGNRNGNLEALCRFAEEHPNVLMEFKTKSDNIGYFLERQPPRNIVCSWSLNTPAIIANEEHFTASLAQRLAAARALADRGVNLAFHFHPLVYHHGWREHYPALAAEVMARFQPHEVLFISFGSVTLIKPVVQKMRALGFPTKITQAKLVSDPHGKLTYTDDVKIKMFKTMYETFAPWRERVFMYLCMEKAEIWKNALGYVYSDNDEFEKDFGLKTMSKLLP